MATYRKDQNSLTYAERTVAHLERQQRSVLGRIGAGLPLREAMKTERWSRELSEDAGCSNEEAEAFTDAIQSQLAEAIGPMRTKPERVVAARVVYAHVIELSRGRVRANTPGRGDGKHMVYILHDADDRLLYVGITDRGPVRLAEHYRHKPWFPQVARVEFERYDTRRESESREKYLIQRRAPLHNIQHNMGRQIA